MNRVSSLGGLTLLLAAFGCRDASTNPAPSLEAAASPPTVFKFMSRGDFGNVSWSTSSLFGNVSIATGDTLGVFYQVFTFDPCCSFATGFGPVSTSDIRGNGASHLSFNTNTCTAPGFITVEGPCGVISIEFDRTSFFMAGSQGTSYTKFGTFMFHSTGTSEGTSAEATGSVVGFPITTPNFAQMGTNQNVQISISRE
jgi:hypothetical protein